MVAIQRYLTDVIGVLGSGGLTNVATTHTFTSLNYANGTAVATLATDESMLLSILDASGNVLEVVKMTAYNSGTKAATIVRAQEGTTAIAHAGSLNVNSGVYPSDLRFIGCAAERTTNQAIASGTWVVVLLDTEVYDTDAIHDTSTNTGRFTIPTGRDGRWSFTATTVLPENLTGVRAYDWKKNGTALSSRFGATYRSPSPRYSTVNNVSVVLNLVAGDYIEHEIYHEVGSSINLTEAYVTCEFLR